MKKNILCIDDIESNIFTIESVLESDTQSRYKVFTALSAHDGLNTLLKEKIDLILLDVMMPEIDGFMTAKMILSNKKTKNIPIIFITAKKDDETIDKCYGVGGKDYVTKPFNSTELLNRISFHLSIKDKEKLLEKEKEYAQSLFDLQDNFIIVTDANQAINVNKATLEFFGLKTVLEFQSKYGCICHTFMQEDGYFHLGLVKNIAYWLDNVLELLKENDVIVKIISNLGEHHTFAIKVAMLYDLYLVALTDITTISEQSKEFEYEANFDSLTQIFNRNMFYRIVEKKLYKAKLHKNNLTFVILDIDHFKLVNDKYGHLVGDEVLKHLVSVVKNHTRDDDIFARWGGEEFVLTLDIDLKKGLEIIENLRILIEKEKFGTVRSITCSFGVTEFIHDDTIESMTKRADDALYEAKKSGRNKVCQA